jgi:hypothetical protein
LTGDAVFYRRVQRKETAGMGSLVEELKRREAAAREEADRPRARIEELSGELPRRKSGCRGWRSPGRK